MMQPEQPKQPKQPEQVEQVKASDNESILARIIVGGIVLGVGAPIVVGLGGGLAAATGGLMGLGGKYVCSFFNPALTSAVGGFSTFAGVGALALPIALIPQLLGNYFMENSSFLNEHPNLRNFLINCFNFVCALASVTAAASILGCAVGPTAVCMMCIPAMMFGLTTIVSGISALLNLNDARVENDSSFAATTP